MRKRKKRILLKVIFNIFFIFMLTSLSVNIFFKITNIIIIGDIPYNVQEIVESITLSEKDSMFLIDKYQIEQEITQEFPYIGYVNVSRNFPDEVQIELILIEEFAVFKKNNLYYLLDINGKIVDMISQYEAKSYPMIYGFDSVDLVIGDNLTYINDIRVETTVNIIDYFKQYEIEDKIKEIDVEKTYDVRVKYDDKYEIKFGTAENMEHKMKFLQEVFKKLTPSDVGIIDLSDDSQARFIPE